MGGVRRSGTPPHLRRGHTVEERRLKHAHGEINADFAQHRPKRFAACCQRSMQRGLQWAGRNHLPVKRRNGDGKSDESLLDGLPNPGRRRTRRKRPFQELQHSAAGGAVVFVWVVDDEELACGESGLDPHGCDPAACEVLLDREPRDHGDAQTGHHSPAGPASSGLKHSTAATGS